MSYSAVFIWYLPLLWNLMLVYFQNNHLNCRADPKGHLKFDLINLNSTSNWFTEINGDPEDVLEVKNVTQLEKDTILVCYESMFSTV